MIITVEDRKFALYKLDLGGLIINGITLGKGCYWQICFDATDLFKELAWLKTNPVELSEPTDGISMYPL